MIASPVHHPVEGLGQVTLTATGSAEGGVPAGSKNTEQTFQVMGGTKQSKQSSHSRSRALMSLDQQSSSLGNEADLPYEKDTLDRTHIN